MRRYALSAFVVAMLASAAPVLAQEGGPLRVSGEAEGELRAGERLVLRATVNHRQGSGQIREIRFALQANGQEIEAVVIEPTQAAVTIPGVGTASFLEVEPLEGAFLGVSGDDVVVERRGKRLRVTVPTRVLATPPPNAELVLTAEGGIASAGPITLVDASDAGGGTSLAWLAVIVSALGGLVVGAAIGAYRPAPARSPGAPGEVAAPVPFAAAPATEPDAPPTPSAVPRKPRPRKAPAKKAPAKKTAGRKAAPKRASVRKPAPRKPTAGRGRGSAGG